MSEFANYIRGKKICFVGASPIIKGRLLGREIDDFDVVVKTNGSLFLNEAGYFRDYGERINVLYCNNQFAREMHPFPMPTLKNRRVQYIRFKAIGLANLNYYRSRGFECDIISKAMNQVNSKLTGALMGCYILKDLMMCRPKKLHVTGIDFFTSKRAKFEHDCYDEYLPGYLPDRIRHQGNKINADKTQDGHGQLENTHYIAKLYRESSGVITMPDFVREIMEQVLRGELAQK